MSTELGESLFGQLPRKGGLYEKLGLGAVAPILFAIPAVGPIIIGGVGDLQDSRPGFEEFSLAFSIVLAIVAFTQILASLIAFTSIKADRMYLPRIRTAKALITPVSYPVLYALIPFEVVAIAIFRVDSFLFVIQSSLLLLISSLWSTVVWFRLRKVERLPKVG